MSLTLDMKTITFTSIKANKRIRKNMPLKILIRFKNLKYRIKIKSIKRLCPIVLVLSINFIESKFQKSVAVICRNKSNKF